MESLGKSTEANMQTTWHGVQAKCFVEVLTFPNQFHFVLVYFIHLTYYNFNLHLVGLLFI